MDSKSLGKWMMLKMTPEKRDEFLSQAAIVDDGIWDIRNDELKELLHEDDLSDDELAEKLSSSTMIIPWISDSYGESHILICRGDRPYLALFTDMDEFIKAFENIQYAYPLGYAFSQWSTIAKDNILINPASESYEISLEILKGR